MDAMVGLTNRAICRNKFKLLVYMLSYIMYIRSYCTFVIFSHLCNVQLN